MIKQNVMKSIEVAGLKVSLKSEQVEAFGSSKARTQYRVDVIDEDQRPRTRVFAEYGEASAYFDAHKTGN